MQVNQVSESEIICMEQNEFKSQHIQSNSVIREALNKNGSQLLVNTQNGKIGNSQNANNESQKQDFEQDTKLECVIDMLEDNEEEIPNSQIKTPQKENQQNYLNDKEDQQRISFPKNETIKDTLSDKQGRKSEYRRISTKSKSMIFDDEYFIEDVKDREEKKQKYINPELFHKLRDHEVEWQFDVFFELLLIHLTFYIFLGPFSIIPFFKKRILLKNLSFWGNCAQFYIQSVLYFLNSLNLILYFASDNTHIYMIEIIYMEVVVFLRAYIIACKYATLHPNKIELYRKYVLSGDLTANDYYFARWVFQKDITIYRESYNAMQRGEFDSSLFYLSFFVQPKVECIEEIEENVELLKKWHQHENEPFQPERLFNQENSVYGYGILSFIIKKFTEKNSNSQLFFSSVSLAVFRGFLLLLFRYVSNDEANQKFTKLEIVQMAGIIYNTSFGYFSSFIFLIYFTKDLRMKDYCQKQCLHLLSPKRLQLGTQKILPTINFLDPFTLKAWSTLRRVLLDYGKPYFLRLEAFISIYIIVAVASLAALLLWLFKAYQLPNNIGLACGFEAFFILSFLLFMLIQGAKINSNFDKFNNILIDYQVMFDDLIRLRSYYFKDDKKSQNIIRSKTISNIKKFLTQSDGTIKEEDVPNHINELINGIKDCSKELNQDFQNSPFLFFGVKITAALLKNVVVGFGTALVAIVQYYISLQ